MKQLKEKSYSFYEGVLAFLASVATGIFASVFSAIITTPNISLAISEKWISIVGIFVSTVGIIAFFSLILVRRERGTPQITKLKKEISDAYLKSIENSPINPNWGVKCK